MPMCRLEGFVLLWKKNDQIISVGQQMLDKVNIHIIDGGHSMLKYFDIPRILLLLLSGPSYESDSVLLHILQHIDIAEYKCDP